MTDSVEEVLSRCDVRDHINYRISYSYRCRPYRVYRALQRLTSPMRYIGEIFLELATCEFFNAIDPQRYRLDGSSTPGSVVMLLTQSLS